MRKNYTTNDLLRIISQCDNYDAVRIEAVSLFKHFYPETEGISEKCRVFFNPARDLLFDVKGDTEFERVLDIEIYDESLEIKKGIQYKQCFLSAFEQLLKKGYLYYSTDASTLLWGI